MSMYDSRAHGLKLGMKAACVHGLWPGASLQLWGGVMVLTSPTTRAGKGRLVRTDVRWQLKGRSNCETFNVVSGSAAGGPVPSTIWDSEHGMFLWNLAERRAAFTLTIE
ncbi:unnamed protein product [Cladocopium goreaui]|uniref:Uncharacterized protein n=1 Tax=Cladocopium goreaui TaxID=2562237 RepID=A0A9P1CC91_9DINO|nr:unnamed protein product [Cladocopium goreaui]